MYKHINFFWPLGIILWIRNFNYMETRLHFHLLCNYMQIIPCSTDPRTTNTTPSQRNNQSKTFLFPNVELLHMGRNTVKKKTTDTAGHW
jgi:hypothetical protein